MKRKDESGCSSRKSAKRDISSEAFEKFQNYMAEMDEKELKMRTLGTAQKKMAREDIVTLALDKFRNGLAYFFPLPPQEAPNESLIEIVAELEDFKIAREILPLIDELPLKLGQRCDMLKEIITGFQTIIQDLMKTMVIEYQREQTKALFSKTVDFVSEEFKSSLLLENDKSMNPDPSVKTEMLNNFLGTDMEAAVKLFQLNAAENGSDLKDGNPATSESARNFKEKLKFEKLESLILPVLRDIRFFKNGSSVPDLARLQNNIEKLKGFLREYEDFSNDEYRKLHARLVEALRIAGKVLLNARTLAFSPTDNTRAPTDPPIIMSEDCLLWCLTLDVDIRDCLLSQKNSLEFKLDKAEYEVHFLKNLVKAKLTQGQEMSLKWDGENLGLRLQDLVKAPEKKTRRSSDLCMEALYYFWKLRAEKEKWRWQPWQGKDFEEDDDVSELEPKKGRNNSIRRE